MKRIIILILLFLPLLSFSQEINYIDGDCVSGNCQNGKGKYVFNNGDTYFGDFVNSKFNGQGKYTYKSGAVYEGSYSNHKRHGKGVFTYGQNSNKLKYEGDFSQGKFHGKGTLTYKDGSIDDGLWENDVFLGTKIGVYQNKDVMKKRDTIIVAANNKKYLLSKQSVMGDAGLAHQLNEYLPKGSFIIEIDLQGQKAVIGYITTAGEVPSLSLYGAIEKYAKSSTGHKFYEKKNTPKIQGEPIGKHDNEIVYKSKDSIIIGKWVYMLNSQPFQESSNKTLKRYFLIGESKGKNFIGWVDYKSNKFEFAQYYGNPTDIPGLNYFGSIYIGPNNPKADGTSNYEIPPQDAIDVAAKEHDICYGNNGIEGAKGVFLTSKGLSCDHDLASACWKKLNLTDMAISYVNALSAFPEFATLDFSSIDLYQEKETRDRAMLVMGLFFVVSGGKSIATTINDNIEPIIDFTASATKTGLGLAGSIAEISAATAGTKVTGFFASTAFGAELSTATTLLAVPVLTVAAVNLTAGWTKCYYHAFIAQDDAPEYCYSTKGIISNAWNMQALKEMGQGVAVSSIGKGVGFATTKLATGSAEAVAKAGNIADATTNLVLDGLGSIKDFFSKK